MLLVERPGGHDDEKGEGGATECNENCKLDVLESVADDEGGGLEAQLASCAAYVEG